MLGSLGYDKDFLGRNRASSSVSRHGSHAAGHCRVATGVFLVATELFFSCFSIRQGILCRDRVWPRPKSLVL